MRGIQSKKEYTVSAGTGSKPDGQTFFFVFVFFTLSFFVYSDFGVRRSFGYIVLLAFLIAAAFSPGAEIHMTRGRIAYLLLASMITLQLMLPYANREKRTISIALSLFISAICVLFCELRKEAVRLLFGIFQAASTLLSIYVLVVYRYPKIFTVYIAPHLSAESVRVANELMKQGYGISIGASVVMIDYTVFFGLMCSLALLLSSKKSGRRQFLMLIHILLCLLAILLENRKGELLCTLLICTAAVFFRGSYDTKERQQRVRRAFYICLILIVAAFFVMLGRGMLGRYADFLKSLTANASTGEYVRVDATSGRTYLWKTAAGLFAESPFVGIGWGNFAKHVTTTYNVFIDGALTDVHNNYLQFLCETGIIGFLLIVLPMLYLLADALGRAGRLKYYGAEADTARAVNTVTCGVQGYFLILGFIDPTISKMFYWCFFGIAVILSEGAAVMEKELEDVSER